MTYATSLPKKKTMFTLPDAVQTSRIHKLTHACVPVLNISEHHKDSD